MIAAVGKDCCARCVPRECDFETKTIILALVEPYYFSGVFMTSKLFRDKF